MFEIKLYFNFNIFYQSVVNKCLGSYLIFMVWIPSILRNLQRLNGYRIACRRSFCMSRLYNKRNRTLYEKHICSFQYLVSCNLWNLSFLLYPFKILLLINDCKEGFWLCFELCKIYLSFYILLKFCEVD